MQEVCILSIHWDGFRDFGKKELLTPVVTKNHAN